MACWAALQNREKEGCCSSVKIGGSGSKHPHIIPGRLPCNLPQVRGKFVGKIAGKIAGKFEPI
jgi:hypothetical protein